jgi:hypothetical protein
MSCPWALLVIERVNIGRMPTATIRSTAEAIRTSTTEKPALVDDAPRASVIFVSFMAALFFLVLPA